MLASKLVLRKSDYSYPSPEDQLIFIYNKSSMKTQFIDVLLFHKFYNKSNRKISLYDKNHTPWNLLMRIEGFLNML